MKGLIIFASLICCIIATPVAQEVETKEPAEAGEERVEVKESGSRQERQFHYPGYFKSAPGQLDYAPFVPYHGLGYRMAPQMYSPYGYPYSYPVQPQYYQPYPQYHAPASYYKTSAPETEKDLTQQGFICVDKGSYSICTGR